MDMNMNMITPFVQSAANSITLHRSVERCSEVFDREKIYNRNTYKHFSR